MHLLDSILRGNVKSAGVDLSHGSRKSSEREMGRVIKGISPPPPSSSFSSSSDRCNRKIF